MDKAAGVPIYHRWADMAEIEEFEFIKNFCRLEAQLSAIHFAAYGGLCLRADANTPGSHYRMLDVSIDPSSSFCAHPFCDHSSHIDPGSNIGQPREDVDSGPCMYPEMLRGILTDPLVRDYSITSGNLYRKAGTIPDIKQALEGTTERSNPVF
jgi:hypothetical protein